MTPVVFGDDPILPPDPDGLDVLHEREYRVRSYRIGDSRLLLRGAVRDQKPAGLYLATDPDPLTIHHMHAELEVAFPSMEIVAAEVRFEAHPHGSCPSITEHYRSLVGLSIARGFVNEVRRRFGGPRGCTHTTALLLAIAPVAIQSTWSMQSVADGADRRWRRPAELTPAEREQRWATTIGSCHVWSPDSEHVRHVMGGGDVDLPIPIRRRLDRLGIDPFTEAGL